MSAVLVIGDVIENIQVKLLRPDTDTPAELHRHMGGSAANTAAWLAADGSPVNFVGRVGDADVASIAADFEAAGVTAYLEPDHERPTGTIVMVVDGETRTMLTDRGANIALDPDSIPRDVLEAASFVHLTGYSLFHHHQPELVAQLISRAGELGIPVMVDASSAGFLEDFGTTRFLDLVAGARVLRCNRDEAVALVEVEDLAHAAHALAARFPIVVATDGSRGAFIAQGDTLLTVAAHPVESVVDPTGAGDAFNAGLVAGLSRSLPVDQAAAHAAELAARAVSRWGARP
jgi:sugar/nucleoside kinase (ribokinase family)